MLNTNIPRLINLKLHNKGDRFIVQKQVYRLVF